VIAFGSVFSATQVVPLIPLTLDDWKHTQIAERTQEGRETGELRTSRPTRRFSQRMPLVREEFWLTVWP